MTCDSYHRFFEAVSHQLRWKILLLLQREPMSVTALCNTLKEEQSKVSHNLKSLASCRIITAQQKGKQRIYSLNDRTIRPLISLVQRHVEKNCSKSCGRKT